MKRLLLVLLVGAPATAHAQLSVSAGIAVPAGNEADFYNRGIHAAAALKLPLPLQLEVGIDRMGGKDDGPDLTILSAGVVVPLSLSPPLVPASVYVLAGGGRYNVDAGESSSKTGVTGGAGVRLRLPGFAPFAEGRGVLVLGDGNKFTYLTLAAGLLF